MEAPQWPCTKWPHSCGQRVRNSEKVCRTLQPLAISRIVAGLLGLVPLRSQSATRARIFRRNKPVSSGYRGGVPHHPNRRQDT
jgi:hypothetical protein